MKLRVLDRQSIFDLAVQALGSVEAAFALALENGLSLTEDLTAGQPVIIAGEKSKAIADYYTAKQLKPATGITLEEQKQEGIDFWGIEFDFIVSPDSGINYQTIEVDFQIE